MSLLKKLLAVVLTIALIPCGLILISGGPEAGAADIIRLSSAGKEVTEKNIFWPEDKIFPSFSKPKEKLIAFPDNLLPASQMLAVSSLQGFANAVETRCAVLEGDVEKWLSDYGFEWVTATRGNAYEYIRQICEGSVSGAVLYSAELNKEYMNAAASVGNTMSAVALTEEDYNIWKEHGIDLPVVADIRDLKYTKTVDIYKWFFENYWNKCNHRILVIQRTDLPCHLRDLASATGGAVVYLSCSGGEETRLFKKYLNTMTPGKSILTGWYAGQERELMTVAAQCGLSCVPADFFINPTVFSQNITIEQPLVPDMPELENKIYIAYFLSDGDNIQYDMHAMRGYWDSNSAERGKVAVNWTISPALVDVAPGMMNYYYSSATDRECFVCGPSGMGYTMPINTFGGNRGIQFRSDRKFKAFVDMTNNYLQKAGLRVITVWDNLTLPQRNIFSNRGSYLYGLTVQNFTNSSLGLMYTGVANDMLFIQMTPAYFASNAEGTTPLTQIENDIKNAVDFLRYDTSAPTFVATQSSVWAFHNIADVVELEKDLSGYYEGIFGKDVVEFVRADHFFNLYYEAHGLPVDVTLLPELSVSTTSNSKDAGLTADGSCKQGSLWQAEESGSQSVTYSLGFECSVKEITLFHAEAAGLDSSLNTKAFRIEVSSDGETWTKAAEASTGGKASTNVSFKPVSGSLVKVTITDPGADGIARIADIDIFASLEHASSRCALCGKAHGGTFADSFIGFIHMIIYKLTHWF